MSATLALSASISVTHIMGTVQSKTMQKIDPNRLHVTKIKIK